MSYLGNTPSQQAFAPAVDYFNGDASTVAFTLSRPVASVAQVQVTIENVPQNPSSSFTVSGSTITFTSAPPSGTSNIYVQYTSPITQVVALPQDPQVFGNVQFSSVGARITGDFSNGTAANQVSFQTSTANSTTIISAIPSGTGVQAACRLYNNSDPTNAAFAQLIANASTDVRLVSSILGTGTYLPMTFYTGGSERVRIDTSGNVGIGTSINSVYDGVAQPRPLVVQSASTATGQYDSTNALVICNSDTTTNNASQLNFAAITGASTNQYTSAVISCIYGARTNTIYPSGILTFATSPATQAPVERMRIDSSGNVLVGTTSSDIAAVGIRLMNNNQLQASKSGDWSFRMGRRDSTGIVTEIYYNSSRVGDIATNGTGTSYNSASDYRLKENVEPMTGALAKVTLLKPCTYKWKVDGSEGQGFIAHELAEVVPDAVRGTKDEIDADGNPQYQGIDTSFLVATLTAAIQEQQALIIQLQADVAALKGIK